MIDTSRHHSVPRYTAGLHIAALPRKFDPYIICAAQSSPQHLRSLSRRAAAWAERDEIYRREEQEWRAQNPPQPTPIGERIKYWIVACAVWAALLACLCVPAPLNLLLGAALPALVLSLLYLRSAKGTCEQDQLAWAELAAQIRERQR